MNIDQGLLFSQERPIDKLANGFIDWLNGRNDNPKLSPKVKVLYHTEPSWNDLWNIHENVAKIAPDEWTRSYWEEKLDAYTIYPCFLNSKAKRRPLKLKHRLAFLQLVFPGYQGTYVKSLAQYSAVIHLRSAKIKHDDPVSALTAVADQCVWIAEGRRVSDHELAELLNAYTKTIDWEALEPKQPTNDSRSSY